MSLVKSTHSVCYEYIANMGGDFIKVRQSEDRYNIGNNIRRLRLVNHLTQEQVVAKMQLLGVDISRSLYSQIECGFKNIKVEEILALCEIFHCDVNTIFKDIQLEKPKG